MNSLARTLLLAVSFLALAAGCAQHASEHRPASTLTEAQRDSAIARSSLPGAAVVGRALDVSGQGTNHAASMDSLSR